MKFFSGCLIFVAIAVLSAKSMAQNVTVVNHYPGNETAENAGYILKNTQEHTIIINEYEQVQDRDSRLREMIGFSVRSYIDNNFFSKNSVIHALKSSEAVLVDLKAIVQNAVWIMDYEFDQDFKGFSPAAAKNFKKLQELNGRRVSEGSVTVEITESGAVPYYSFQKLVYQAKVVVESEVDAFLKGYSEVLAHRHSGPPTLASAPAEKLHNFLEPLDFELQPITENNDFLAALKPQVKIVNQDTYTGSAEKAPGGSNQETAGNTIIYDQAFFNTKILELLEDNNKILASYNDRFASMQDQIDQIKNEQLQAQKQENREIRQELAELREMVMTVLAGKEYVEHDGSKTRRLELEPVRIVFQKNQYTLTYQQKLLLREVKQGLEKNSEYRVLITGYADKTGDKDFNTWISRQRALEVKNYLENYGIDNDRLVVNYFGESKSTEANPDDRRVDVEWLVNFTAQNRTP